MTILEKIKELKKHISNYDGISNFSVVGIYKDDYEFLIKVFEVMRKIAIDFFEDKSEHLGDCSKCVDEKFEKIMSEI